MSKRGAGEGTIFQRGKQGGSDAGRWVGMLRIKGQRKVVYGRTYLEVKDKLTDLRLGVKTGRKIVMREDRRTIGAWLTEWLEAPKARPWRPSTKIINANLVRLHIAPRIGLVRLTALSGDDIMRMVGEMRAAGCSDRLIQMAFGVVRKALKAAKMTNALADVIAPSAETPKMKYMTAEHVERFLAASRSEPVIRGKRQIGTRVHRLHGLYVMALKTGLRQGELFALRWQDVDWKGRMLRVRHSLSLNADGKTVGVNSTKTVESERDIPLGDGVVSALREHQARMFAEGKRACEFVFCDRAGRPLNKDNVVKRSFQKILKRAELGHFRFHDLRGTYATLASEGGADLHTVKQMMGHKTLRTTERYAHSTPKMQREAAEMMDKVVVG